MLHIVLSSSDISPDTSIQPHACAGASARPSHVARRTSHGQHTTVPRLAPRISELSEEDMIVSYDPAPVGAYQWAYTNFMGESNQGILPSAIDTVCKNVQNDPDAPPQFPPWKQPCLFMTNPVRELIFGFKDDLISYFFGKDRKCV